MSHQALYRVWICFTVVFAILTGFSIKMAFDTAPHFDFVWAKDGPDMVVAQGLMLSQEFQNFTDRFNQFVDDQNRAAMLANLFAALGYLVAGVTSGISAYLERKQIEIPVEAVAIVEAAVVEINSEASD